jgi:uncharacterized protein (TIGR02246 family)
MFAKSVLPAVCVLIMLFAARAEAKSSGEEEVRRAEDTFVQAFSALDWERFHALFADDATVFFSGKEQARRASGRAEFEPVFKRIFDDARKRGNGPPYLHIEHRDVEVQMAGDVAVMTLHLDRPDGLARRTLIWRKQNGVWRIMHIHASDIVSASAP